MSNVVLGKRARNSSPSKSQTQSANTDSQRTVSSTSNSTSSQSKGKSKGAKSAGPARKKARLENGEGKGNENENENGNGKGKSAAGGDTGPNVGLEVKEVGKAKGVLASAAATTTTLSSTPTTELTNSQTKKSPPEPPEIRTSTKNSTARTKPKSTLSIRRQHGSKRPRIEGSLHKLALPRPEPMGPNRKRVRTDSGTRRHDITLSGNKINRSMGTGGFEQAGQLAMDLDEDDDGGADDGEDLGVGVMEQEKGKGKMVGGGGKGGKDEELFITRKTKFSVWLKRGVGAFLERGCTCLTLHALGAAIPTCLTLVGAIRDALPSAPTAPTVPEPNKSSKNQPKESRPPDNAQPFSTAENTSGNDDGPLLPFPIQSNPRSELLTVEFRTSSVDVRDEITPDDETRTKSSIQVVLRLKAPLAVRLSKPASSANKSRPFRPRGKRDRKD